MHVEAACPIVASKLPSSALVVDGRGNFVAGTVLGAEARATIS